MDFPIFHLDFVGNRLLFAVVAITHVLINHALAVGAMPVVALLAWRGWKTGDRRWDELARRILFVCFVVTTTAGALTGVGIWLTASLVNPLAIGSLIRVFFWAWFTEWLVFVAEVVLILTWFLTWQGWGERHKRAHLGLGAALSVASWLTMAIIVAILGFQMDTGVWTIRPTLASALLNPLYLPQLAFRTPFAMVAAGLFALFLAFFFAARDREFRARAVRLLSVWCLAWTGPWFAGAWLYRRAIPAAAAGNLDVALGSLRFEQSAGTLTALILAAVAAILAVSLAGALRPARLPRAALLVPCVLAVWLLGTFERVREFIRKPDVVAGYLYANGLRHADYPLLAETGVLAQAAYTPVRAPAGAGRERAGAEMFRLACTRCHTTDANNGVVAKLTRLYGAGAWETATIDAYLAGMHNARPFMPPLPGNAEERAALADYLIALRQRPARLPGAQSAGVALPPPAGAAGASAP